tara:strand:- start:16168 stop:16659 length:492 start_codon:yes stop_codon:yes gene_type:complete
MEYIKIKHIYDFISLVVNLTFVYGVVVIFTENNVYILFGLFLTYVIQKFIKIMTKGWNPKIFKRPDSARDTSALNTGGYSGNNSGFPSGHTFAISYFIYYLILNDNSSFTSIDSLVKQSLILLVAYARVRKRAHRTIQVIAGYFFGLFLAYAMVNLQNYSVFF